MLYQYIPIYGAEQCIFLYFILCVFSFFLIFFPQPQRKGSVKSLFHNCFLPICSSKPILRSNFFYFTLTFFPILVSLPWIIRPMFNRCCQKQKKKRMKAKMISLASRPRAMAVIGSTNVQTRDVSEIILQTIKTMIPITIAIKVTCQS